VNEEQKKEKHKVKVGHISRL